MSLNFVCTSCQVNLRAKPELAGKRVRCPKCGQTSRAPSAAEVPPERQILDASLWGELVGKKLGDEPVQQLCKSLGKQVDPAITSDERTTWYAYKTLGVSLSFDKDEVLRSISLSREEADGHHPFAGKLPCGLTFKDTRREIEGKLGIPTLSKLTFQFYQIYPAGISIGYSLKSDTDMNNTINNIVILKPQPATSPSESKPQPVQPTAREYTPLHSAAENCDVSEAQTLIFQKPILVHTRDMGGNTPLRLTVSIEVAKALLRAGADVNTANDDGLTPLHKAAYSYNAGLAVLYLEHGATVDARSNKGITPLISGAMAGNEYQMSLLLERGADPAHTDQRGISAINEKQGANLRSASLLLGALDKVKKESPDDGVREAASTFHAKAVDLLSKTMLKPLHPPGDIVLSPSGRGVLQEWQQDVSAKCRELRSAIPALTQQLATESSSLWQVLEPTLKTMDEHHGAKDSLWLAVQAQQDASSNKLSPQTLYKNARVPCSPMEAAVLVGLAMNAGHDPTEMPLDAVYRLLVKHGGNRPEVESIKRKIVEIAGEIAPG